MKFNEPKKVKKTLTEEERAAITKARKEAAATDRKVAEGLAVKLPKMSRNQLRGELKRIKERGRTKEGYEGDLGAGIAAVLLTMLDNTKTKENPFGKLTSYPR
jgi:hypothetical protein